MAIGGQYSSGPAEPGKDLAAWWLCIRKMVQKPTQIYFVYPTYSQGKKILWEGLDNNGFPLLDYLPKELIASKNGQEMSIKLINGSFFKIVGSDEPDRLVGTNPQFLVFSEYALQNENAWKFLRQVIAANMGTACFISTPRGRNAFYDLYEYAKTQPDEWFVSKLTVDDTKHITPEELEKERRECSEDLIQQEFFTSFSLGIEGSYYSKYLNAIRVNSQITNVPWQPYKPVHLSVDIGYRDSTAIVWFQKIGDQSYNIIDCYQNTKQGLDHYAKVIKDKPYLMGKMIFPHDLAVTEYGSGLTRLEQARALGLNPTIAPKLSIEDGIEAVRALIPRCYFDEVKTQPLLKALESYRQQYDPKKQIYMGQPTHDWSSHFADSFRYFAVSQKLLSDTLSAEDLNNIYLQSRGSSQENVPKPFQQPNQFQGFF